MTREQEDATTVACVRLFVEPMSNCGTAQAELPVAARTAGAARGRRWGAGVSYERVRAALLRPFPACHLRALGTPTPRNACLATRCARLAPAPSTPWHPARLAAAKAGCAGVPRGVQVCSQTCCRARTAEGLALSFGGEWRLDIPPAVGIKRLGVHLSCLRATNSSSERRHSIWECRRSMASLGVPHALSASGLHIPHPNDSVGCERALSRCRTQPSGEREQDWTHTACSCWALPTVPLDFYFK